MNKLKLKFFKVLLNYTSKEKSRYFLDFNTFSLGFFISFAFALIISIIVNMSMSKEDLAIYNFNKSVIENRIISICNYLNLNSTFESFLEWILNLRKELNIPHKLSDVMDCNEIDLEKLSLMAFEDPSTGGNPKKITQDDLKEMYKKSISGELF